jgi:hypothetical protein
MHAAHDEFALAADLADKLLNGKLQTCHLLRKRGPQERQLLIQKLSQKGKRPVLAIQAGQYLTHYVPLKG